MRSLALISIAAVMVFSAGVALADESRDHVCFRALDANRDGEVTLQEFEKHFENDRESFDKADRNKDGRLTHDEYHDMLGHGAS